MIKNITIIFLFFLVLACTNIQRFISVDIKSSWQVKQTDSGSWIPATVPGTIHADLLNAGIIPDPYYRDNENKVQWVETKDWVYRTYFSMPPEIKQLPVKELVFDGLDTYATVILNGDTLFVSDNMFFPWRADVSDIIRDTGNELIVVFESPVKKMLPVKEKLPWSLPSVNDKKGTCPLTRKAPYHYGWDWGPRLVTSGIWKPVRIEAWDKAYIQNVFINTDSVIKKNAFVSLKVEIFSSKNMNGLLSIQAGPDLKAEGKITKVYLTKGQNIVFVPLIIDNAQLWYPAGYGNPYLYNFTVKLLKNNDVIDERVITSGIRTVQLVQKPDSIGKSFGFVINGIPVFAKGANIIPLDNMLNRATFDRYNQMTDDILKSNMNMVRTWGGGIYENDIFYELCDKKGILVWQDFMFGNEMYYVDSAFLNSVKEEATYNIKRLRNHPSIVIWCGDNEGEWMWKRGWDKKFNPRVWEDYKKITYQLLPSLVKELDTRPYWRSSPSSDDDNIPPNDPRYGDMHDWSVHFGPPPYEKYRDSNPRFVSEFGHQSFPDRLTLKQFTDSTDQRVDYWPENYGQKMKAEVLNIHNKQPYGNQKIRQYMEYYYTMPAGFFEYAYVSQLCQAEAVKCGVEHYRRLMPYCMGALFWQLNDCWPVISWSSIDYFGRWKALQYYASKFYAPVLISPFIEKNLINIYIISDLKESIEAQVVLRLIDFNNKEINKMWFLTDIEPLTSKIYSSVVVDSFLRKADTKNCVLDCKIIVHDTIFSRNHLYFEKPKDLQLNLGNIFIDIKPIGKKYELSLKSDVLIKNMYFFTDKFDGFFSDNFFDILPGELYKINWASKQNCTKEEFQSDLKYFTLNQLNR